MRQKPNISMDIRGFIKSSNKLLDEDYPRAVAVAFKRIAREARNEVRQETRRDFKLHTDYIPNSILSTPHTPGQLKAGARSVVRFHDIESAVFLRPANTARRSLDFMVPHETGQAKTAHGGLVAVPAGDLDNYQTKTSRGATRKKWKPAQLLADYNKLGGNVKGNKLRKGKRSGKGIAFIKKSKNGVALIVRRKNLKSNSLEVLYSLKKKARIKPVWGFEPTVDTTVRRTYKAIANRSLSKMRVGK